MSITASQTLTGATWAPRQRAKAHQPHTIAPWFRTLVSAVLWCVVVVLFFIAQLSLAYALVTSGASVKMAELGVGFASVPLYFTARGLWRRLRLALVPTEVDRFLARQQRKP